MSRPQDRSQPWFPVAGQAKDGYSNDKEATATCYCGSVQLAFPLQKPGLVGVFLCNCTDCRKITASTFASNFTVEDTHLKHLRGESLLKSWGQDTTTHNNSKMTNYFCSSCGTLMYRRGSAFPGKSICRIGTVDDFHLAETVLKPEVEQFTSSRVGWLKGAEGVRQVEGSAL